jgi:hypothetical protein
MFVIKDLTRIPLEKVNRQPEGVHVSLFLLRMGLCS